MSLTIILGPMWSGKTTEMFRRGTRYELSKKKVLYVKHIIDNRYEEFEIPEVQSSIVSHDKRTKESVSVSQLGDITKSIIDEYSVICIDEGHFYPDIVTQADEWCKAGKILIVSALNSDFEKKPFDNISKLIANSDKIVHLTAICTICGSNASFTKRLTNQAEKVLVGGENDYTVLCRKCYNLN